MKKKKFKLVLGAFLIIIGIVTFSYQDVKASVTTGNDPESGVGYSIENFRVYMYNQEGMEKTQSHEENSSSFVKVRDVTSEISVTPSAVKVYDMNDHEEKNDYKLISVKLNIDGGFEKAKEVMTAKAKEMKNEGISGGDNEKYVVTLSVVYKLTLPQSGSWQVWDIDYGNVFSETQKPVNDSERNSGDGVTQMVITGIFDSTTETIDFTQGATFNFNGKIFTSRVTDMPLLDGYSLFQSDYGTRGKETYRFLIHDKENIEGSVFFLEDYKGTNSGDDNDDNKNNDNDKIIETKPVTTEDSGKQTQTVAVPNTAANEKSRALLGSSLLLFGSSIVLFELRKKFY